MTESHTKQSIRLALSNGDVRLFPNNTGTAWQGEHVIRYPNGDVLVKNARAIKYGLVVGGSDLVGWKSIIITLAMIGQRIAQFVAVEVKSNTGRPTDEQRAFVLAVRQSGGRAGFARSVPEAREILDVHE
jgi:hypothetical protein